MKNGSLLVVNTLPKNDPTVQTVIDALTAKVETAEVIHTEDMKILPCVGCNYCWLKTPGVCAIRDDYEPILKKMSKADQVWLITDTCFGFVSYQTKNIMDRVMPIVTMYLKIKNGQMRHVMRYEHQPDIGIIYTGEGDQDYLNRWCARTALNFGSHSLGAFRAEQTEEAISCML